MRHYNIVNYTVLLLLLQRIIVYKYIYIYKLVYISYRNEANDTYIYLHANIKLSYTGRAKDIVGRVCLWTTLRLCIIVSVTLNACMRVGLVCL